MSEQVTISVRDLANALFAAGDRHVGNHASYGTWHKIAETLLSAGLHISREDPVEEELSVEADDSGSVNYLNCTINNYYNYKETN